MATPDTAIISVSYQSRVDTKDDEVWFLQGILVKIPKTNAENNASVLNCLLWSWLFRRNVLVIIDSSSIDNPSIAQRTAGSSAANVFPLKIYGIL